MPFSSSMSSISLDVRSLPRLKVLQGLKATDGVLASMRSLSAKVPAVEALREGHLLRWTKQMALRGRGRCFDENGTCGRQKLVFTGEVSRLLAHFTRLFPGAQPPVVTDGGLEPTREQKLYEVLSKPGLPDEVSTKWIGQQMQVPWRDVSKHLMPLERVQRVLDGLGWSYVSRSGRAGGCFRRIASMVAEAA
jgi:hypothetical protein